MNGVQKKIPFYGISCFLMIVLLPVLQSELIEVPRNIVVLEGKPPDEIDMTCKSDYQIRLKWDVHRNNDSRNDALYSGYYLRPDAKSYCTAIADEPRKCYLRLKNTAIAAKTYICVEPGSLREASADLISTKSNPICNDSSTEDLVNLTCSIEFRGNWAPTMEWKEQSNDGEEVLTVGVNTVTIRNQSVTSTLVMKVPDGSRSYTCTTKFDISGKPNATTATNVPDYNRNWTSSAFLKSQDQMTSKSVISTGTTLAIVMTVVTVTAAASAIVVVCLICRKRRREAKEKAKDKENQQTTNLKLLEES